MRLSQLPPDATLPAVERAVLAALRTSARRYNQKRPEVIVLAHELDPRCVMRLRIIGPLRTCTCLVFLIEQMSRMAATSVIHLHQHINHVS